MKKLIKNPWLPLLLIGFVGAAAALLRVAHTSLPWDQAPAPEDPQLRQLHEKRAQLEAREQEADRTIWAKEILAENCGRTIEDLWDSVNASSNKLERIAAFPVEEVVLPDLSQVQHLPHGIDLRPGTGPGSTLSAAQWRQWVAGLAQEGWQLDNLELRQNRFATDANGQPWQSHYYFAARLTRPARAERAILEGDLLIDWRAKTQGQLSPGVRRLDGRQLKLRTRVGEPFFKRILDERIVPEDNTGLIDPLILYDLDGDGLSEIILAAKNVVYHRSGPGQYEARPLCRYPVPFISTALIADFDGDGVADLLCANGRGLFLFKGNARGTFDEPARLVWTADPPFKNAMVMTCGDVDEDGALDVFIGQYKVPSLGQILRPHYYDANDSWPAYLLRNDGHGNFTDITVRAGLGSKRWRRVYSASLVDLDRDGHLDLAVASDFAGLDLYQNDGHGHFTEVTRQWVPEPHEFGMAQALADFNADGRLDLLMIGMPSPTVDRLESLDLHRPYSAEDRLMRPAMTYGNRLFLARTNGGFEQTALNDSIARSGWSWGCSAFDFDNDGFPDVYIANGLESKQSVRDYESEFWLHDIFVDDAIDDITAGQYFAAKFGRTRGSGWSYGGYEKNRLFLNQHGESFIEIGHLAGVSLEQDSRNVVADDLDGDGRMDLLVTTFEVWPRVRQTLQVYQNQLSDSGHWIGFRFHEQGGPSPVGANVTLRYRGHQVTRSLVTGDSHRSQSASTIHFGLGDVNQVDSAEIRWVGGAHRILLNPKSDEYHDVQAQPARP